MTVKGSPPATRYFVMANDAVLVVLNLTAPTLPATAAQGLRAIAATRPDHLMATEQAGAFRLDNVQVGRDGVFVGNGKVADLNQVVETVARDNVSAIWGPVVARGSVVGTVLGGMARVRRWCGSGSGR